LTQDILKALLVHYDIKIQCLYDMIFVDGFSANLHPPSANGIIDPYKVEFLAWLTLV